MAKREVVSFKGTMAELTKTLTLNGKSLSQPFLSQLVTYGLHAKVVGTQPNVVGKGKPTNIIEVTNGQNRVFAPIVADAGDAAPADAPKAKASGKTVA